MVASSSKEEQLARIRRNQQRCRDRKRAYVEELESQIQKLQDKLRACLPCDSTASTPAAVPPDDGPVHRENAGRRELLLALGVSEKMQQRFIDSAAQRQAVYAALNARSTVFDSEQYSTSPATGAPSVAAMGLDTEMHPETSGTRDLPIDYPASGPMSTSATSRLGAIQGDSPLQQGDLDLTDWMFSMDTTNWFPNIADNTPSAFDLPAVSEPTPTDRTWPAIDPAAHSPKPLSKPQESLAQRTQRSLTPPGLLNVLDNPMDRCFFETAINFRPGHSSTTCSVAIRLVLQHNQRGLSLAQLHERMKPGFCAADGDDQDCRVQDTVFMRVLKEISATDRGEACDDEKPR